MKSQEPSLAQQRKNDHVQHALDQHTSHPANEFDRIRFIHHSFNQTDFDTIDLSTTWAQHQHAFPFYINGMTGGSDFTYQFNDKLSHVAQQTGLAMASGSVSAALKDLTVADSYRIIRKNHPTGFILANIGAHHTLENAQRAVDILQADALQIHLNIPQEVVMPEGDRDFSQWEENIAQIVEGLTVPVIVKEVGFGMSHETLAKLTRIGVSTVDISGRGGTNFIQIENERRNTLDFSSLLHWGQTTPESLIEAQPFIQSQQLEILASGGIRHFTDIFKAIAMGAQAVGLSGHFLKMVHELGVDQTVTIVEEWKQGLTHLALLLGTQTITELQQHPIMVDASLAHWAHQRGIAINHLAQRPHPLSDPTTSPSGLGSPFWV